jgi:hypothetical protein
MGDDGVRAGEVGAAPGGNAPHEADAGAPGRHAEPGSAPEVTDKRESKGPAGAKAAWRRVRKVSAKAWAGGVAVVVTGVLVIFLGNLANVFVGPHTQATPSPSASTASIIPPIVDPGHLPGRLDVSTMTPGQRFYAVPNFYFDQGCGRPCWLPLYAAPNENSAFVTNGWPCEYYGPNHSSSPSCVAPPKGRATAQMANPADKESGDRLLVLCQTKTQGNGLAAQDIRNQVGQDSDIWDRVAVPKAYISSDSPAVGLSPVPGMPGFYQAYAPDMWLGNTGWHSISCA